MGPWMHDWGSWGWMAAWHLLGWAVLAVVIIVTVTLISRRATGADGGADRPDPEQILAERFARGEIDTEEYRSRREELRRR